MADSRARQELECRVIQNARAAFIALHDPAVPVAHIFAEADVGNDEHVRQFLFKQTHRLLYDSVSPEGRRRLFVLAVRYAKQQDRRHSQFLRQCHFAEQFVG